MARSADNITFIRTIPEKCRVCYTCVRECPAKAIRIADGQAEVLAERCIACGNCVRVCSQKAKDVRNNIADVYALLAGPEPVAAIVAPSFAAEFPDTDYCEVVGSIRSLGFDKVCEVAFGADLVAAEYSKLLSANPDRRYVATTCPAIIGYIERYHPGLIEQMAPIVSPMIATARALHRLHGADLKIVFIGPCVAKKLEAVSVNLPGEVDAAITFAELRTMLDEWGHPAEVSDFDPPHAGMGAIFPVSRGLLQAAKIDEGILAGEVVAADGRSSFTEAIRDFESGDLDAHLLEVLACTGCVMGAGMTSGTSLYRRRQAVGDFVRRRLDEVDPQASAGMLARLDGLDLSRSYASHDQRIPVPFEDELAMIMARMGKHTPEDELNCGACGYETCRDHAVAIFKGLAESEMCLPYTIDQLKTTVKKLAVSNEQLASAQAALMQSEKLASMGQLAAGIAHEVNNPLGVVLMYAHLLLDECKDEHLYEDLSMIVDQADRCKKIVAGLLHFARQNKLVIQPTNVPQMIDRAMRVMHLPAGIGVKVEHEDPGVTAELDADQIVQVLTNLASNAQAAMAEGGELTVRTRGDDERVYIEVSDTGTGIPADIVDKIFEPFFTTKQIGKGTGLGLAVTYGIVKMHRGDIKVASNTDAAAGPTGTTFTVELPRKQPTE